MLNHLSYNTDVVLPFRSEDNIEAWNCVRRYSEVDRTKALAFGTTAYFEFDTSFQARNSFADYCYFADFVAVVVAVVEMQEVA